MAKSPSKTRRSLIIILNLILIISASYLTINNYLKLNDLKKNNDSLKKEYNTLNKEYKDIVNANSDISNTIEDIKNLDTKIKDTKENVFKLASQVEKKIQNKETNYKIAYITFDDGPYYLTNKLLDLLKEKQVKVTFFTIGSGKTSCYDNRNFDCTTMYKKEADAGHTVANHTYSHAIFYGLYSSVEEFMRQVQNQEDLIFEKTGTRPNILRFPGGSRTAGSKRDAIIEKLREKGYGWVDWTAQDGDGGDLDTKEQAWSKFTSSINDDIEVILFHDYDTITYSILPDAIDYLENKNYILLPLFYDSVMINK